MRMAAFEHVRRLDEVHDQLTANELKPGFIFDGKRIPLVNPQRGIFKPKQMQFLLSIKTVFPKPGGKIWYEFCYPTKERTRHLGRLLGSHGKTVVIDVDDPDSYSFKCEDDLPAGDLARLRGLFAKQIAS